MIEELKSPFPWFGGKSQCADAVWSALGDVQHYVEPFAGSLAVLLQRPHAANIETVNDKDCYIVNFWRALQHDPDGVANHVNNPVNEADLTARHIWLVNEGQERIDRCFGDPEFYDVKVAGWWVWGINCWIGGGFCSGNGPWTNIDGRIAKKADGQGVNRKRVHMGSQRGVNRQRVNLSSPQGVNRKRVHLSNAGRGVNRKSIHADGECDGTATGETNIAAYLRTLAERLRYVRVCCGDWRRVLTNGALSHGNTIGIFLDPPYDRSIRSEELYNIDGDGEEEISPAVRRWCLENQHNPRYRIVLAGYEGEHDMPESWTVVAWKPHGGYTNFGDAGSRGKENRHIERLWLSPNCLKAGNMSLFEVNE